MPLGDRHQALFDVFCHAYDKVLESWDALDDAASYHTGWDGYRVIRECINVAASSFGSMPVAGSDRRVLTQDLIHRMQSSFGLRFPDPSPVFTVAQELMDALSSIDRDSTWDVQPALAVGERLSLDWYALHSLDSPRDPYRPWELVIEPGNVQRVSCVPDKTGGVSRIRLDFCCTGFSFDSFVNLPFYFLHEFVSHIHTATLFAEGNCADVSLPFEDGWLLYAALNHYLENLSVGLVTGLSHPGHRDYYTRRHVNRLTGEEGRSLVRKAYEYARQFQNVAGVDLYQRLTGLLATTPFDCLGGCADVHTEFMSSIGRWIRRMNFLGDRHARDEAIQLIGLSLDGPQPIQDLISILREN